MERAKGGDPRLDVISKVIDENGGRDFLRELHSQVTQLFSWQAAALSY